MIWYVTADGEAWGSGVGGSESRPSDSVPGACAAADCKTDGARMSRVIATNDASQRAARERRMVECLLGEREYTAAASIVVIVGHAQRAGPCTIPSSPPKQPPSRSPG